MCSKCALTSFAIVLSPAVALLVVVTKSSFCVHYVLLVERMLGCVGVHELLEDPREVRGLNVSRRGHGLGHVVIGDDHGGDVRRLRLPDEELPQVLLVLRGVPQPASFAKIIQNKKKNMYSLQVIV